MVAEVLARAVRRRVYVLLAAAAATGLIVTWGALKGPAYLATLTLRMQEGDLGRPEYTPRPPAFVREYISNVALTRQRTLEVMARHGLSAARRAANPVAAVNQMRSDIDIEVRRNFFLYDRDWVEGPRYAHIVLSFTGGDRDQAAGVVHDLGSILLGSQAAARESALEQARASSAEMMGQVRAELAGLEAQQASLARRGGARPPAEIRTELALLGDRIGGAVARLQLLEKRAQGLEMAREAEQQKLGLVFEPIDESVQTLRRPLRGLALLGVGGLVFLTGLPVLAVLVGGFATRIHRAADVAATRFPLLGAVPRFQGDDEGSYRARCARAPDERKP